MREIKFRVWDRRIEKMGEVTEIRFSRVQHNLVKYRYTDDRGKVIDEQSHFDKGFSNGLDIMQYTGMKDINSKEIYEGDIYSLGDGSRNYIVVWHDTSLIGKQIGTSSYAGLSYWQDRIKVLGNVFENPELMKGEKR